MEENFEVLITGRGWIKEDFKALTSQLKEHESLLRLKRRWLMGLSLSKREQEHVEELLAVNDKILPESLIREDDVNYDDIRSCVERGYNAFNCKTEHHGVLEDLQIFNSNDVLKDVFFLLDDMTNKGLYSFVEILTGGLVKYEKTNWCMKKIIREFPLKVGHEDISKTKLKHIFQLLKDVTIFRGYQAVCTTSSEAYCAAGIKILDGLEDFPFRALSAMHRKVRRVGGYIPTLQSPKSGCSRDGLINSLRKKCMKMLLDLGNGNELAESLAGALGVAGLTLKLLLNQPAAIDFRKFSPEIETLQNDIAKAIFSINDSKRVSMAELKRVHFLLSPNAEMSVRSLRMAVRNLLMDYLFECSDMDKVPNCLLETLDIINNRSQHLRATRLSSSEIHLSTQEEEIQKEVEYVLIVSAQAKEVVWNFLPEHALDQDFADAYMEDLENSDLLCISDDDEQVREILQDRGHYSHDSKCRSESICETSPVSTAKSNDFSPLLSPSSKLDVPLISSHATEMDPYKTHSFVHSTKCGDLKILDCSCADRKQHLSGCVGKCGWAYSDPPKVTIKKNLFSVSHSPDTSHNEIRGGMTKYSFATPKLEFADAPVEQEIPFPQQSSTVNQYLEVQETCDAVSMVAYQFVGLMLDELTKMEGLELYQCDRLYLRSSSSNASVLEDSEESSHISLAAKFSRMWKDVLELCDFSSKSS